MYDLNLLPIRLQQGQPGPDSGGFMAVTAPRRAARGRAEDVLILALSLAEGADVPSEMQQAWLNHLAQAYFKTSGSVTAALRTLIETLNLTLMEKNLKSEGIAVTGAINLAVVHRHSLYLAQSGPTHAFMLNHQGLQHHTDPGHTDRGLGVSRAPAIRYFQDELGAGAFFFTADSPPASWTEMHLVSEAFPGLEQMRRRLLNQAPPNFQMTLTQLTSGEGRINLIRSGVRAAASQEKVPPGERQPEIVTPPPEAAMRPEDSPETDPDPPREVQAAFETAAPEQLEEQPPRRELQESPPEITAPGPVSQPDSPPHSQDARSAQPPMAHLRAVPEPDAKPQPARRPRPEKETGAAARETLEKQKARAEAQGLTGLAAGLKWWRQARNGVETFFKDLVARWSPEGTDGSPTLSRRTLILIAIIIPLVVVAITAGVYLVRGRTQQYTYYLNQAEAYAEAASLTADPAAARSGWTQALTLLDTAESYRATDETAQLRDRVQDGLDLLDGAVRLDYRPALIGELYSGIEITRIVPFGSDLYLLDEAGGRVIHAARRSQGYEVDADFVCAAGNFTGGAVGALVDMVALPINNPYQAHVLAVDAAGNLAYCAAGQEPLVMALPAPGGAAGEITAIAYSGGYLYTLNPTADSIRVYLATNGQFQDVPTEYFEGADLAEKPNLSQIVDMSVNGADLYLLQTDGLLVDCVSSGLASNPVNCENPVTYVDGRAGLEDQPVTLPEAAFVGVLYTEPPDPSVSVLDATHGDIYRFSLRFRLYQRLRPEMGAYEVDEPTATAFAIGIDRVAFLAYGHQLFFAYVD